MGKLKSALFDAMQKVTGNHSAPHENVFTPTDSEDTKRVYGLYADNRLIELYEDKATADYDAHMCREAQEQWQDELDHQYKYTVRPLRLNTARFFDEV